MPSVNINDFNFDVPEIGFMSDETITENTKIVNSKTPNPRLKFILSKLVDHLHDFARETRLTTEEWDVGIDFLTRVGQTCTEIRQEFILLSDVLGLSVLVDGISHPKPEGATIGTLLGPFHTHDAEEHQQGDSICSEGKGEPLLITGKLTDLQGEPIEGASIDLWECDENGLYDTQYPDRDGPDCRGIVHTNAQGEFVIKCIKPTPYPIPHDGPVGQLLQVIKRHPYRPAHIHFIIEKPGYDKLITALYHKGDPFENSDAVFGVKTPLLFELVPLGEKLAKRYDMNANDWYLEQNFTIVTEGEARECRIAKSKKILKENVEGEFEFNEDGLPIASVD